MTVRLCGKAMKIKDFKMTAGTRGALRERVKLLDSTQAWRVNIEPWSEKRSLSANALQHVWYKEISNEFGWSIDDTENYCKCKFGVPIIIEDVKHGPRIRKTLDKVGYWDMNVWEKAEQISVLMVTSLLSTKQHTAYRDAMQIHFVQHGIQLEVR